MENTERSAALIVWAEGAPGQAVELGDHLTLGRAPSNQLVINDAKVSRNHAEIRQIRSGCFQLWDLGSANGTWLNGRRVTMPRELKNGDTIQIGTVQLQFVSQDKMGLEQASEITGTSRLLRPEQIVVLVADIRSYTSLSETMRGEKVAPFIADWFQECSKVVERHGGTIDKFLGDAVLAYWIVLEWSSQPAAEVNAALDTASELVALASRFSTRLGQSFPGHIFAIGIGVNAGEAVFGNLGTGQVQSFTVVGDSVNVAFRLESLTKEAQCPIVVSRAIVDLAENRFQFKDLGPATVKGRKEPVHVFGLTP
jgi:adenylate cyclase